jgi:predicted transcriptional regulator of viral defense system
MSIKLGKLEAALLAYAQLRDLRTIRTGDLREPLLLSPKQESSLLERMTRRQLIAQVRRGLYLVPEKLPLGGLWSPDDALAINTLIDDQAGRYQISGPNAFHRYGFDKQVPTRLTVYNNRLVGDRTIGAVELSLVKVADARLGGTVVVRNQEGNSLVYASRARTLVDAVYDWSRFDSLPRGYEWIRIELAAGRVKAGELVNMAVRFGNQGTSRRLGALLESLGVSETLLRKLERTLRSSGSRIPLVPGRPRRGETNRRWGVVLNEQS